MRFAVLAIALIGAATLGGCSEGVLDPKGPVASAERLIMLNSTGIRLAIVIPKTALTLALAPMVKKWCSHTMQERTQITMVAATIER